MRPSVHTVDGLSTGSFMMGASLAGDTIAGTGAAEPRARGCMMGGNVLSQSGFAAKVSTTNYC